MANIKKHFYPLFLIFSFTFVHGDTESATPNAKELIQVEINPAQESASEQKYNLKLSKPDESVLHPNIKVISLVGSSNNNEMVSVDTWTPSNADLLVAQEDLYIDEENLAAVRLASDESKGEHVAVSGVVNGNLVEIGQSMEGQQTDDARIDYIDIGRNITPSRRRQGNSSPYIVEVLLVCDKEFGDVFNHDRRRILDYFTVYFWDVNLRYKTLPSINIAFRITGIVIINSPSGQPFIEEARASDGRAEFGRILSRFSSWVYNQMSSLPKFDMAIAITNTRLEWGGGLAYYRTACYADSNSRRHYGTLVWNDGGDWGSLTVGAHEIAHSVGAPHDDDPNVPGGCQDRGYIMSGGNDDLKWFFSTCSDRLIGEFVRSNEASCLRRLDETSQAPPVSPDFSSVLAPGMQEQCRRRLNNPQAFIPEEDTANCKVMKCWVPQDNGWLIWSLSPVDNTPCLGGGRCFRGRCRKIGKVLMNVGSGQCARAQNPFAYMTPLEMTACPNPTRSATPLDQFVVEDSASNGKFLQTPYSTPDAKENGDKCMYTGNAEGDGLWTDKCNLDNPWQGWNMIDLGTNGEFQLRHRVSYRCARHTGGYIRSYGSCDRNDRTMRWKLV